MRSSDVGKRVRLTVWVKAEGAMTRDTLSRPRPPNPGVALSRGTAGTVSRLAISDSGGIMKRRVVRTVMTALAIGLVSCGGGGSSPSTSTPNPPSPITKGLLLISQTGDALYGMTPAGLWRVKIPVEVRAMNDIPLTLNYARLTLYDRVDAELLRVEVTSNDILAQAGSNHVTHDRTLAFTLVFLYVPRSADHFTVLLNATDANGNNLDTALLRADFRYLPDPELQ